MLRRMVIPALFGLIGTGILVNLGLWQLSRADEKAALIAEMEARIFDAPVALPATPTAESDRYRPVQTEGRFTDEYTRALAAQKAQGPGFHLISVLETDDGRRVLVDRGFMPDAAARDLQPALDAVQIVGNLHWPRDTNASTPPYDTARNLFFGRDVGQMAALLNTEPVLIVLRASDQEPPLAMPVPVHQVSIPDNHLGYAVQWFLMAIAWAGMTVFFLWRIRRQPEQE
jgi:surfeit locus 1 family protein